ncbi:MAG: hypothetical protein HY537_04260 [Deltaproteobacteria bacterium]|nr:hypothetical protein [Deltaproteobacteria bacterium]
MKPFILSTITVFFCAFLMNNYSAWAAENSGVGTGTTGENLAPGKMHKDNPGSPGMAQTGGRPINGDFQTSQSILIQIRREKMEPINSKPKLSRVRIPHPQNRDSLFLLGPDGSTGAMSQFRKSLQAHGGTNNIVRPTSATDAAEKIIAYAKRLGTRHLRKLVIAGFGTISYIKIGRAHSDSLNIYNKATIEFINRLNAEGIQIDKIYLLGDETAVGVEDNNPHLMKTLAAGLSCHPEVVSYDRTIYFGNSKNIVRVNGGNRVTVSVVDPNGTTR